MDALQQESYLGGNNALYLEQLYEQYLQDPNSVSDSWKNYFSTDDSSVQQQVNHSEVRAQFANYAAKPTAFSSGEISPQVHAYAEKQAQVYRLISAYRMYGHHHADLDPIAISERMDDASLALSHYGLEGDENVSFEVGNLCGLDGKHKLSDIVAVLKRTYCGHLAIEYKHITNMEEVEWIQKRIETHQAQPQLNDNERKSILRDLTAAEGLEKYLGRRYVGQKRFSLEGGDSLIPLLHDMTKQGFDCDIKEIIIGMAHRGRLNVLVNILGKKPVDLFQEFEGSNVVESRMGDVKYHLGFSSTIRKDDKEIHMSLACNPSHLEIVSPVVQGAARAKQRRRKDKNREEVLPIVLHGDAAFAGQGVVMEAFAMSQARGFKVGGTIHVVINNQVGFTTSNPLDARSSLYCTDVAKMIQAPVLHVNGDDPEAVVLAARIALEYRTRFHKDVVIDMICYRLHGHNESDEPSATQPVMYKNIKAHSTPRALYANRLIEQGLVDKAYADGLVKSYQAALDNSETVSDATDDISSYEYAANWKPFLDQPWRVNYDASIEKSALSEIATKLYTIPEGFELQAQVKKVMADRLKMAKGELAVDWGFAENLAYATLLEDEFPIRICGEDVGRGTFAHRHAVLHDQVHGADYTPLQHMKENQASFIIINSLLSEEGVLAFEYGFASTEPSNLVVWEAQFGDFANCAQVVIDQFISSGEQKWGKLCGLVMLLPHGYEGMGAEHSSARLERYLQLCGHENMQVCVPSTPAQIYALLRRQMVRKYRKPLIVMTPKSLLRHKLATSSLDELARAHYDVMIPEVDNLDTDHVNRVVLCCGKVYYDLLAKRREEKIINIALIRIEQLYPFPKDEVLAELKNYSNASDVVWCQEEPKNQGAWFSVQNRIQACLHENQTLQFIGRAEAAAPAVGYKSVHDREQKTLVNAALKLQK